MRRRLVTLLALAATLCPLPRKTAGGAAGPLLRMDRYGDPLPPGAVARLGTTRFRVPLPRCVVWSRDGKTLISGGFDGRLHVWEAHTGRHTRSFKVLGDAADCLALSPDGKLLAAGADPQNGVGLWDLATGKPVRQLADPGFKVACVAFSPDGRTLASCGGFHCVFLWDVASGKRKRHLLAPVEKPTPLELEIQPRIAGVDFIRRVAFSPDGKWLAAAGSRSRVYLWDTATGKLARTLKGPAATATALTFSPDGKRLFTAGFDGTIRLQEAATGRVVQTFIHEDGSVQVMTLSPDGRVLAAASEKGAIRCWDAGTGKLRWRDRQPDGLHSLGFCPRGKVLASAANCRIVLWDATTGRCLTPAGEPTTDVSHLCYSPDGTMLAVASGEETARLLDTRSWRERARARVPGNHICSLRFGPGQRLLAAATTPGSVHLWDVFAGRSLGRVPGDSPTAIAPDGDRVVVWRAEGRGPGPLGLTLGRASTGKLLFSFRDPGPGFGPRLALSADGGILAAGGQAVSVWETTAGTPLADFAQRKGSVEVLAFSPDGRIVLSQSVTRTSPPGADRVFVWELSVWEVASGERRLYLPGLSYEVEAACFSPDGRLLAAAGEGGLLLWDLATGEQATRVSPHVGGVIALAFSPDGETLVSGGGDTTILVWKVDRLLPSRTRAVARLTAGGLERLWRDLGDARKASRAIWSLAGQAGRVEPFLERKLKQGPASGLVRIHRLIGELDSDDFATRQNASRELEKLGRLAWPALRKGLQGRPSLEATLRIKALLGKLHRHRPGPDEIRAHRALEALARVGTPEARRLLEAFTAGGRK